MESPNITPLPLRLRLLTIVYGAALLFWQSAEDNSALPAALFGAVGSALILYGWWMRQIRTKPLSPLNWRLGMLLTGIVWGAGSAVLTTILMFFKTAWHSHIFPDYPTPMMLAMLERAPIWSFAGLLLALAWVLWNEPTA
jgi:hypothetical protein